MSYARLTPAKEYPLPHGYGSNILTNNQQTNEEKRKSNYQYFLTQSPGNEKTEKINKQELHRIRIFENTKHTPIRRALSQTRKIVQTKHRIFDIENSVNETFQLQNHSKLEFTKSNDLRDQIAIQLELAKIKSAVYSGSYQKLLNDLIIIIDSNRERSLLLNHQFNDIIFQIRTLDGLDISDKVSIEKILNTSINHNDRSDFIELVKKEIPNEWQNWLEPLYYECFKRNIQKEEWQSFIQQQRHLSN